MPNIKDLTGYSIQKSLGGGTRSTSLLSKPGSPPVVLKYGASQEAISLEILCNRLYAMLGVKVPASILIRSIPVALVKELNIPEDSIDVPKSDNFIQSQDNQIYLIDAGSNFIFRALGEKRTENTHKVTEIELLKTYHINNQQWFGAVTETEIQQQVVSLLQREYQVESIIWELSNLLKLSNETRYAFLDGLSNHFNYLALRYAPALTRRRFHSPHEIRMQYARTIFNHLSVMT